MSEKSRRPPNTAFRQQRLKAWQPILTPRSVLPLLFLIGVIFTPLGGGLLYASEQVQELTIEYTHCVQDATSEWKPMPEKFYSAGVRSNGTDSGVSAKWKKSTNQTTNRPMCSIQFTIPSNIGPSVFLYYKLTNFYQNHRRYVKSLDEDQLNGKAVDPSDLTGSDKCSPLAIAPGGKAYYPCGLIANSYFNDTFGNPQLLNARGNNEEAVPYVMTNKNIAWDSFKRRFGKTKYNASQIVPPPNWAQMYPDGYTDDNIPNLHEWEALMNWMHTAALPTFSKLAQRNDKDVMQAGTYSIDIQDNFPVTSYGGTKSIILTTISVTGGKNLFLGIAYIAVGGLCIILGIIFLARHIIKPRKLGDHRYLTWNTSEGTRTASAGTASDHR